MASELPPTCIPDRYLSKPYLQELFNDFDASITASRPAAPVFSSLVNTVRQVYSTHLLEAKDELHKQARQISKLKRELEEARALLSQHTSGSPIAVSTPVTQDAQVPAPGTEAAPTAAAMAEETQDWPADTHTLYISSSPSHHRRDWASWDAAIPSNEVESDWALRLKFEVFRFQEPGLVKISVYRKNSPLRSLAVRGCAGDQWWKDQLEFWAYDWPKPGTQRFWSGYQDRPERGIFVKGDREVSMEEWEHRCQFWVPEKRIVDGSFV